MTIKMTKTGEWDKYRKALDPKAFKLLLDKEMSAATRLNVVLVRDEIQRRIMNGDYAPNAPMTKAMKGSDKPLVDDGDLVKAINDRLINHYMGFVGIQRGTMKTGDGGAEEMVNIALILHEGTTIKVTPRMRAYFYYLARKSGGKVKPLKATTKTIVIPPRKFIEEPVSEPAIRDRCMTNWGHALQRSMAPGKVA